MTSEAALPPLETLIKPEQVHQVVAIAAAEREKYVQGVKKIWDALNTLSPDDPEYIKQYQKLVQATNYMKDMVKKHKERTNGGPGRPAGESVSSLGYDAVKKFWACTSFTRKVR